MELCVKIISSQSHVIFHLLKKSWNLAVGLGAKTRLRNYSCNTKMSPGSLVWSKGKLLSSRKSSHDVRFSLKVLFDKRVVKWKEVEHVLGLSRNVVRFDTNLQSEARNMMRRRCVVSVLLHAAFWCLKWLLHYLDPCTARLFEGLSKRLQNKGKDWGRELGQSLVFISTQYFKCVHRRSCWCYVTSDWWSSNRLLGSF